jgi:ferric-dicitrate binding protein FerR (iron transport regulator)
MINFLHDKHGWTEDEFRALSTEEKILEVATGFATPVSKGKSQAFESLKTRMAETPKAKTVSMNYWLAAAAVLVIAVVSYVLIQPSKPTELMSENGTVRELSLPDGSKVILNAGSKVTYSERKFDSNRQLSLAGEAFFEVQKGSSFIVETTNGSIKVLGTQFNVLSRSNDFRVECQSGKVGVMAAGQYVEIVKGQQAKLAGGELVKIDLPQNNPVAAWRSGEFSFDNEPIVSIFEELERQFNVKFELPDLKGRFYSGGFTNKDLNEALAQVCIPMELNYEIRSDRNVIITKKR